MTPMSVNSGEKTSYSRREAASALGVSDRTVDTLIRDGKLAVNREGRTGRFVVISHEALIECARTYYPSRRLADVA